MENNIYLTQQIRTKLQAGEVLTVASVLNELHTYELRHYISAIKRLGVSIETRWCSNNGKRFKEYYLKAINH